jgi:hypothetical protein
MLFSSGDEPLPTGSGADIGNSAVGPADPFVIVNPAAGQSNHSAVNPIVGQYNPALENPNQLVANRANGPIQVPDTNNQNFIYNKDGTNQPLLGNIGRTLRYQNNLGLIKLNRYTFTSEQSRFVLDFLYYNHREIYDIVYPYNSPYAQPLWHKINNNRDFTDLLKNAN